jgi:probable H4MPT-linked C1 transfer pathway protein
MTQSILALDIGGANLKAAHSSGAVSHHPFELWRDPAGLPDALGNLLLGVPPAGCLSVTMTGELCDCFATKREGVAFILDAVVKAADGRPVWVWQNEGRLYPVETARNEPLRVAAANWLALAAYCGRFVPDGPALVVDVGSTTTDIVPLFDGRPVPQGRTDPERLRYRELIYTGVRRTPLCALMGLEGAAELFATTQDVYLILGDLAEDESDRGTADGRPATRTAALSRLARMRCADAETGVESEALALARELADRQLRWIVRGLQASAVRLGGAPGAVVTAGAGEFLARAAARRAPALAAARSVSISQELGPAASQAACAYGLMVLAGEQLGAPGIASLTP